MGDLHLGSCLGHACTGARSGSPAPAIHRNPPPPACHGHFARFPPGPYAASLLELHADGWDMRIEKLPPMPLLQTLVWRWVALDCACRLSMGAAGAGYLPACLHQGSWPPHLAWSPDNPTLHAVSTSHAHAGTAARSRWAMHARCCSAHPRCACWAWMPRCASRCPRTACCARPASVLSCTSQNTFPKWKASPTTNEAWQLPNQMPAAPWMTPVH